MRASPLSEKGDVEVAGKENAQIVPVHYAKLEAKLELSEAERRELAAENRQLHREKEELLRENGELREKIARLEERKNRLAAATAQSVENSGAA